MGPKNRFALLLVVVFALTLMACASKTPFEKVVESRSWYTANLNSFFVKETPIEAEPADLEDEGAEGSEVEEDEIAADGEEAPVEPEVRKDAVLDVIVQHDTSDPLDGLTLDISMVDADENEVAHWRYWVDTSGLLKANQRPYSIVFEDVAYEEGYGFHVEVLDPVPEADRGLYRELEGL